MRRTLLFAAAPACLLIGLSPTAASALDAPGGSASATAAQVSDLVGISSTGAHADSTKAQAEAAVIKVGGQPLLGTGGSASSDGDHGGALLDTGATGPIRAQVAPWHTKASGMAGATHRTSTASAALARAEVPDAVRADVLKSDSTADHTTAQSTASSTSEALNLALLGDSLHLILLHSEVTSVGQGHSYLVGLNGTEIGTNDQLGKTCALSAPDLLSLSCLTASGGAVNGVTSGASQVAGATTAVGLNPVSLFNAAASFGPTPLPEPVVPAVTNTVLPADTSRAVAPAAATTTSSSGADLPRTGTAPLGLAVSGLTALLGGLIVRRFSSVAR